MKLQEIFDKFNKELVLSLVKKLFTEHLLIKMIAFIITIILFVIAKTERMSMETIVHKSVPVRKRVIGDPPPHSETVVILEPNKVDIYGPLSRVRDVREVETEVIDIATIKTTTVKKIRINIQFSQYFSVVPMSVKATIQVQSIK